MNKTIQLSKVYAAPVPTEAGAGVQRCYIATVAYIPNERKVDCIIALEKCFRPYVRFNETTTYGTDTPPENISDMLDIMPGMEKGILNDDWSEEYASYLETVEYERGDNVMERQELAS